MTTVRRPPLPRIEDRVTLKYGAGGRAMRALIQGLFAKGAPPVSDDSIGLAALDDGAALRLGDGWIVLTTDSPHRGEARLETIPTAIEGLRTTYSWIEAMAVQLSHPAA